MGASLSSYDGALGALPLGAIMTASDVSSVTLGCHGRSHLLLPLYTGWGEQWLRVMFHDDIHEGLWLLG